MHFRKLAVVIGLICLGWAQQVLSLGLGEITLNSSLNQPLDADIRLLQVRDLAPEEIRVSLASQQVFRDYGVERPFFLQELTFDVQLGNAGGPVVKVTSRQPVREPFVNFIIELQSPNARLMREYTLLMDLPVFDDQPAAPVQRAQTPAPARPVPAPAPAARPPAQTQAQPVPAPQRRPAPPLPTQSEPSQQPSRAQTASAQPRTAPSVAPGADAYTVRAGDTLWEIALATRPDRSASVQQTMLALQRLNPDAFIGDNINLLRRGQVLRIPSRDEILRLNQRQAVSEVALQNNEWQSGSAIGAELEASRTRTSQPSEDSSVRGEVRLSAPSDTQGAGSRSGSGDAQSQVDSLQNELAIGLEELDKSERENDELRSRVSELEEQIETMDRLIDLNSEELRDLQVATDQAAQESLEQDQASEIEAVVNTVEGEVTEALELTDAVDEISAEETVEPDVQASTAPEVAPAEVEASEPTPQIADPKKSLVETIVDSLLANLLWIGIAVVAIVAVVFFLLHRRSQAQMDAFDALDDDEEFYEQDYSEEESQEQEDDFALAADDEDDIGDDLADLSEDEPEVPTEAETGDAVAEADIYIAYGKHDQAAEMLQKAIITEPANLDARLKLLEVYAETKDVEKFDIEYGQLIALGDEVAITRAAALRSNISGAGQYEGESDDLSGGLGEPVSNDLDLGDLDDVGDDFSGPEFGSGFADDSDTEDNSISLDSDSNDLGGLSIDLDDGGDADLGDGNLDFQLDLDADPAEDGAAGENLDFSLDLDETSKQENTDLGAGLDLSLDLDLDDDDSGANAEELGDELTLDLSDNEPSIDVSDSGSIDFDTTEDSGKASGDELLTDLEFGSDDLDLDGSAISTGSGELSNTSDFDLDIDLGDAGESKGLSDAPAESSSTSSDLNDDFDVDMGDLDLAALDQEMDELVGGLDDLDDDDELVAPTEVMAALDDDFSENDLGLKDLGLTEPEPSSRDAIPDSSADLAAEEFGDDLSFAPIDTPVAPVGDGGVGEDINDELDFLADTDEVATKLDLARAYIDMGDKDGAKDILEEVTSEGNAEQQKEAKDLLEKIS